MTVFCIDAFAKTLREAELLTKQDINVLYITYKF